MDKTFKDLCPCAVHTLEEETENKMHVPYKKCFGKEQKREGRIKQKRIFQVYTHREIR